MPDRMHCPYKCCVYSSKSGLLYVPAFNQSLPGQGVSAPRYRFQYGAYGRMIVLAETGCRKARMTCP
ncbi:MAG TPA: hypothetical protein PLK12_13555 [Prolixibacteraceae bacterium]|nr:hypothetical protein [Prolixibacteraceae bacterium]